jgi:hypothetical protein
MTSSQTGIVCNDSSTHSVTVPFQKYDVFISFRGEDTRNSFTSHLHAALSRSSIRTYIDYKIDKGKEVWAELLKAIKRSTLFLVVFSKNYASSTWCLNELIEIMKCNKKGHDVIPVFYHIDPSHVRKQTGSYHTSLANHKIQGNEKMQKWKDALFEAANLSGFHYNKGRYGMGLVLILILKLIKYS